MLQYLPNLPQYSFNYVPPLYSPHSDYLAWQLNNASIHGRNTEALDLLRRGVNPNDYSYYPLHIACQFNDHHTAVTFIQWGADLRRRDVGWTPLHFACGYNHIACVKVLLEHHSPTGEPGYVCS